MGTLCSHKPDNIKATDWLIDNHLNWSSSDAETGDKHTVLVTALVGMREFYAAVEHLKADGTREVWAAVLKVTWHPKEYCNCCVKSMSEHEGPYFYNCPEKILKLLTLTNDVNANEWRQKCWSKVRKAKAAKDLKVGDRVKFWDHVYQLDEYLGRKCYRVHNVETGQTYLMGINHLKQSTLITDEATA